MTKSDKAIKAILGFNNTKSRKILKNFKVDEELAIAFDSLCRQERVTFTEKLTQYMQLAVDENQEKGERL